MIKHVERKRRKISQSGRRARVGRCVQNSEEFSEEKVFSCIFRPSRLSENSAYDPEATTPPNQPAQTAYKEVGEGNGWADIRRDSETKRLLQITNHSYSLASKKKAFRFLDT